MKPLTQKQENFCIERMKDGNATRAYKAVYSVKNMSEASIAQAVNDLIKNPKIVLRMKEIGAPVVEAAQVSAKQVIDELARIAFFDVGVLYNDDGTLKEISQLSSEVTRAIHSTKQRIEKQGQDKEDWAEIKEIRTHDKLKALELLGKTIALFTDKHEHTGTLSLKDFVEQRKQ